MGASALGKRPPKGSCGHREVVGNLKLPSHLFLYAPQTKNGFHIFKWLCKYLHNILEFVSWPTKSKIFTENVCRSLPYKNAVTVGGRALGREQKEYIPQPLPYLALSSVPGPTCCQTKGKPVMLSEEVKLPRHRARKTEKCREWMGADSSWRVTNLLCAPTINREHTSSQCKTSRDTGKTPSPLVKVGSIMYLFQCTAFDSLFSCIPWNRVEKQRSNWAHLLSKCSGNSWRGVHSGLLSTIPSV